MAPRVFVLFLALSAAPALAGMFGPPKHVKDACKKWCGGAADNADAADACAACHGPQMNPKCATGGCDYCETEINFPRHYPKLWKEEPTFHMAKLEGKTRCWCDTGCPVYYVKSSLFCHKECAAVCSGNNNDNNNNSGTAERIMV
ncbi:unnamed protein product [Polarella glacialis]|uniref:Uncharacterized protein n=1 Tax=Polarella glacialis TaxID=89957 RepID=A0A813ILF1_POLGL|nr:unnamed protein product [Polarella glacialis]